MRFSSTNEKVGPTAPLNAVPHLRPKTPLQQLQIPESSLLAGHVRIYRKSLILRPQFPRRIVRRTRWAADYPACPTPPMSAREPPPIFRLAAQKINLGC